MYQYWGFGLNIESEIEFPELLSSNFTHPDLTIYLGNVPTELSGEDVIRKVRMSASPDEYLLNIGNVAKYYAAEGKRIIIESYPGADTASIRLFMLSNAMAAILHQQNKIPFHASGIITTEGLVLFTGRSGVGKSTTAWGLMQYGYKLFTDDVCVLSYNNSTGNVEAYPSYPMMKLWENTIDQFANAVPKDHRLRPELPKYGFYQHDVFTREALPVSKVFLLKTDNLLHEYKCNRLDPLKAFNNLQQNTYRRRQVDMMKLRESHFQIITHLTKQATVAEVLRPQASGNIPAFIEFIKEQLHAET